MANMCSNFLEVSGNADKVASFYRELKYSIDKQKATEKGVSLIPNPDHYLFDLWLEGESIGYETKWAPNIEDVKKMHLLYGVDIVLSYVEPSSLEYGKLYVVGGISIHHYLDESDVIDIEEDEDEDTYLFKGKTYESKEEIWEKILEDKYKESKDGRE